MSLQRPSENKILPKSRVDEIIKSVNWKKIIPILEKWNINQTKLYIKKAVSLISLNY